MHSRLAILNAKAAAAGLALVAANSERDAEVLHVRERATLIRQALRALLKPLGTFSPCLMEQEGTASEFGITEDWTQPPPFPPWAWFVRLAEACGIAHEEKQEFWEEEVHGLTVAACHLYNITRANWPDIALEARHRYLKASVRNWQTSIVRVQCRLPGRVSPDLSEDVVD